MLIVVQVDKTIFLSSDRKSIKKKLKRGSVSEKNLKK